MVKVKPSAFGLVTWKVKSLVNVCTLTGVVQKALATSYVAVVSGSGRRGPLSVVCPLNWRPAAEKPEPKLTAPVDPPVLMVMTDCAVALGLKPVSVAMARTVVVALTTKGAVYGVEPAVGGAPLVV